MNKRTINQAEINVKTNSSYSFIASMLMKYGDAVIRKIEENSGEDIQNGGNK